MALAALAVAGALALVAAAQLSAPAQVPPAPPVAPPLPRPLPPPDITPTPGGSSRAVGAPWCGHLLAGVPLAAGSSYFFTWELPTASHPNPTWRRYGTSRLINLLRTVAAADRRAHPHGPRIGIADLSLPRGGPFGPRYGGLGHLSHQNGLDADVLYPRLDGREAPVTARSEVDRVRAQQLLDRFVAAGAARVFVGFGLGLRGPRGVVSAIPHHQDHMHVRIAPADPVSAPARCPWHPV